MECDNFFSLWNLSLSSYENEVFTTSQYISNTSKMIIFTLNTILWSLLFIWLLGVSYNENAIDRIKKFDVKKKIYSDSIMITVIKLITFTLILTLTLVDVMIFCLVISFTL